MDNDLNNFFVTVDIFRDSTKIKSLTIPKSLVHDTFQLYVFPGSPFNLKFHDDIEKFSLDSKIMGF